MPVAGHGDLDEYLARVTEVGDPVTALAPETDARIRRFAQRLRDLDVVDRDAVAGMIRDEPEFVPILGAAVGLSKERLKGQLQLYTGSPAWVQRSADDPGAIIDVLDEHFGLLAHLEAARDRTYTYADVLVARSASTSRAVGSQATGQLLEDLVEHVVHSLGLDYETQTRFVGAGGRTAPADFAIPAGGDRTLIAIAVKGYGSTGSKLTTTYDEVRGMADTRRPNQAVYVVADGIGWMRRKSDLRRILELNARHAISGVFPVDEFDEFEDELREAAVRARLLSP